MTSSSFTSPELHPCRKPTPYSLFFRLVLGWVFLMPVFCVDGFSGRLAYGSGSDSASACPKDLSHLSGEMEEILKRIWSPEFKKAMRTALTSSIPEAIQQADGLRMQILFLRKEIQEQGQVQVQAEQIARKHSANVSGELIPCPIGEKGSYCSAVEQYDMARAANLANRGFLDALECYWREGLR